MFENKRSQFDNSTVVSNGALNRFVLVLNNGFSALDYSCIIDALSHLAENPASSGLDWITVGVGRDTATSESGLKIGVVPADFKLTHRDTFILVGGSNPLQKRDDDIVKWLRTQSRQTLKFGATSSGVFDLADAGLLKDHTTCVNWAMKAGFVEQFPQLNVCDSIFNIDAKRFTCAGGVATADMMLALIGQNWGEDSCANVADRLICSVPRTSSYSQRLSGSSRGKIRHAKLAAALRIMQTEIENPLRTSEIAARVGVSCRQMERLFTANFEMTPKEHYVRIRLETARSLLLQTEMRVIDVAVAAGFNCQSHFSKVYKRHFGISPQQEKGLSL